MKRRNYPDKFDWNYFLKYIAIIAVSVALQNLLTTTGSMIWALAGNLTGLI